MIAQKLKNSQPTFKIESHYHSKFLIFFSNALYIYLNRYSRKVRLNLFFDVTSNRRREKGLKSKGG